MSCIVPLALDDVPVAEQSKICAVLNRVHRNTDIISKIWFVCWHIWFQSLNLNVIVASWVVIISHVFQKLQSFWTKWVLCKFSSGLKGQTNYWQVWIEFKCLMWLTGGMSVNKNCSWEEFTNLIDLMCGRQNFSLKSSVNCNTSAKSKGRGRTLRSVLEDIPPKY